MNLTDATLIDINYQEFTFNTITGCTFDMCNLNLAQFIGPVNKCTFTDCFGTVRFLAGATNVLLLVGENIAADFDVIEEGAILDVGTGILI